MNTIRQGSTGPDVVQWQRVIGVDPDGSFGPATRAATVVWQESHELVADGVVGPKTWKAAGIGTGTRVTTSKGIEVPPYPGFLKLPSSDKKAMVKAAQWIAPGEQDAAKWLATIIDFESDKTWSPSVRNRFSRAVGIIQFIEPTARALGTTTDALARMSFAKQLEYVKRYFAEVAGTRGKIHSLNDMYLSVFSPKGVGRASTDVLYSAGQPGYDQNAGLDHGGKGFITVGDVTGAIRARLASVADLAPVVVTLGIGLGTALAAAIGIGYLYTRMKGR